MHKRTFIILSATLTITAIVLSCVILLNNTAGLNVCTLSDTYTNELFGITPKAFCEYEGIGTVLYNAYTSAQVDNVGNLVIKLTDSELIAWRASSSAMNILQRILGEQCYIGIETTIPQDPINKILYESAPTSQLTVSDDFTLITATPESNHLLIPTVMHACLFMQVTSGVYSDDATVKYIEMDEHGDTVECIIYPDDHTVFEAN